jgi:hypothetical protein
MAMAEWDAEAFCETLNGLNTYDDMLAGFIACLSGKCPKATSLLEDSRAAIDQAQLALIESCPTELLASLVKIPVARSRAGSTPPTGRHLLHCCYTVPFVTSLLHR